MQRNEYQIIVLKPTPLFRLFLSALRPDMDWPSVCFFQHEVTAYRFDAFESEDVFIAHMERHFLDMCRHELAKWIGKDLSAIIKISFFDFLRFFKFEQHALLEFI